MIADETTYELAETAINQMETVGSDENFHIVTLLDQWEGFEWKYLGSGAPVRVPVFNTQSKKYEAKMYYIEKDNDESKINSKLLNTTSNINSGDPKNLAAFIALNQNLFPSEKIAVVLWGVGSGFNSVPWKDDIGQFVAGYELGKVFQVALDNVMTKDKNNFDLVAFDSGFMANYELAYELSKNKVSAMVGPQGNITSAGFPYAEILLALKEKSSKMTPVEAANIFGEKFIESYDGEEETQISVLDLTPRPLEILNEKINILCSEIMKDEANYKKLHNAADRTLRYYHYVYKVDLLDLMDNIASEFSSNQSVVTAAHVVKSSIEQHKIIAFNQHSSNPGMKPVNGMSIYFPLYRRANTDVESPYLVRPYSIDKEKYENSWFAKLTHWDKMVENYYNYMEKQSDNEVVVPAINLTAPVAQLTSTNVTNSASTPAITQYTVKSGDNLTSIADAHGMTVEQICSINNISNPNSIYPGQVLILSGSGGAAAVASSGTQSASPPAAVTASASGKYRWPTQSRRVTSPYGWRIHPVYGTRKMHNGIDIGSTPIGTTISAPANGRITYRANAGSAGNMIIVNHGNGKETVYMHMHRFSVSAGQNVTVGEKIGEVGNTGASTGPHLHFETRENDRRLDPIPRLE